MTLYIDTYQPGDAVKVPNPAPIRHLTAWASYMPPGESWTAKDAQGQPIACLGVWNDGGILRAWARLAVGLGPHRQGWLIRAGRQLLDFFRGQALECHVEDEMTARWARLFGFERVSPPDVTPIKMRICP